MTDPYRLGIVFQFICDYVAEHNTGPLVIEVAAGCGLTKWEARRCISILAQQKRIRKTWRHRSIAPADVPEETMKLTKYRAQELKSIKTFGKLRFD